MPRLINSRYRGVAFALAAAALFGASMPFAKLLLRDLSAVLLAGLLYLSSGIGLGAFMLARLVWRKRKTEAQLTRKDLPWLTAAVMCGGVVGPRLVERRGGE